MSESSPTSMASGSLYGFSTLLVTLCMWSIFYLFFSAWVLGRAVSFLLNVLILRDKSAIQIQAIHFALLRGMLVLRDVTYTTPNISIKMVDCVLSIAWWRTWSNHPALLHLTSRGLEYYIVNNSARYEDLERILHERERGVQEQGVHVGLEVPPDAPLLFWLSKNISVNLSVGCLIIGNTLLPSALVVSFEKAFGTVSLVDKEPYTELQRVEADIELHECTVQLRENMGWKNETDEEESEKRSVWQGIETWQYWEGFSALKEGLAAPLNFLRVRGENAEHSPEGSGRGETTSVGVPDGPSSAEGAQAPAGEPMGRKGGRDGKRGSDRRAGAGKQGIKGPAVANDKGGLSVSDDHLLKSPLIQLKYYDDLCGFIAKAGGDRAAADAASKRVSVDKKDCVQERTVDVIPERGIVLEVAHASLIYGPWENRQRVLMQSLFLPADYETRTQHLHTPGYVTNRAAFRTDINLRGSVRLHVPFSRDCSVREADFTSVTARGEGCSNFLTLISGTPLYNYTHRAGLRAADVQANALGRTEFARDSAFAARVGGAGGAEGSGGGGEEGKDARAAGLGAVAAMGLDGDGAESVERREGEGSFEGRIYDEADGDKPESDSDVSEESHDSYQSSIDTDLSSMDLFEEEDQEWNEILSRSGLETLPVVGVVHNVVPFWMGAAGSEISTDVEVFDDVRISSNIPSTTNDAVFWRSAGLHVATKMQSGLAFNDKTSLQISVISDASTVHLLRDHGELISAVLADWAWRPNLKEFTDQANDPLYFVPSSVEFRLHLGDGFELGLIVNDDNVVDDFADAASNAFLWLSADELALKTVTNNATFQPTLGRTEYTVDVPELRAALHEKAPASIYEDASPAPIEDCMTVASLRLRGSFTGWRPSNSMDPPLDTSAVDLDLRQLTVFGHGIVINRVMCLIKNYFGSVAIAISRREFEASERAAYDWARSCPDRVPVPGWNNKLHALRAYNADKKSRPNPCEQILRVTLLDMVLLVPQHESITALRHRCAHATCREALVELRSIPDLAQLVVSTSAITIQCAPEVRRGAPAAPAERRPLYSEEASWWGGHRGTDGGDEEEQARSGVVLVDRVRYSQDSSLGPPPDCEAYKCSTRLQIGRIDGELSPAHLAALVGAVAQLTRGREAVHRKDSTHLPGRLWLSSLAHNIFEASVAPVHLCVLGPSHLAGFTLAQGLSIKGNNLICSAHNNISTINVPTVSASLHQRSPASCEAAAERGSFTPRDSGPCADSATGHGNRGWGVGGSWGEKRAGDAAAWSEEVVEVARAETSLSVCMTSRTSDWEERCLEQYDWLLLQDRDTWRHGLSDKLNETHESYHDADEPTSSSSGQMEGKSDRRVGISDRSSENFLTADDFVTSEDISWHDDSTSDSGSYAATFESQLRSEEQLVLPNDLDELNPDGNPNHEVALEDFAHRLRKAEDRPQDVSGANGDSHVWDEDEFGTEGGWYSAPTTPKFGSTPVSTRSARGAAGRTKSLHRDEGQDATPCLARRLVRKKSVPCSRLAHNANERDSGKDLGSYRLCSDVAVLLQPPTADSTGGGCDRTGGFARYSMMRGHKQGEARCPTEQEPEPEPVHYAWHLRLRPKISPLSHSFSEGHKGRFGLLRQEREHEDESDKRIPKVAQGTRLQHTAFKSKSFSKGTSDATASADVSLGFVTHCTHFRMGLLNVNASPEALQTIDDITVSLPNDACSVEGCLDHLRAMTKDHREAPLSFAFYGLHQVKKEFRLSADGVEVHLLHQLVPFQAPVSLPDDIVSAQMPTERSPANAAYLNSHEVAPEGQTNEDAEASIDGVESGEGVEGGSQRIGQGNTSTVLVALALTNVSLTQSNSWWSKKPFWGRPRRMHDGNGKFRGCSGEDDSEHTGKVAGSVARHMRNLCTFQRQNVSELSGTCRSLQGFVSTFLHDVRSAAAVQEGGKTRSFPRDCGISEELLARSREKSLLLSAIPANGSVVLLLHGEVASCSAGGAGGFGNVGANGAATERGSKAKNAVSFSMTRSSAFDLDGGDWGVASPMRGQHVENVVPRGAPVVCTATISPMNIVNAASAATSVLPAVHVWLSSWSKLSHTCREKQWVTERNVSLVLDQPIPALLRSNDTFRGLSRSKSFDLDIRQFSRGAQYHLPKGALPPRCHSDNLKSVLKCHGRDNVDVSGMDKGNRSKGVQRHNSDQSVGATKDASPVLPRLHRHNSDDDQKYARWMLICYTSVSRFVQQCSIPDLSELQAALGLPISWSMVSQRTLGNIASSRNESMSHPVMSLGTASPNLEVLVQVEGISCFFEHREKPHSAFERTASCNEGECFVAGDEQKFQTSEIHLESSTLMVVSMVRETNAERVSGIHQDVMGSAGVNISGSMHAGAKDRPCNYLRDVVCQLSSGTWNVNVLPPMVKLATQISQLVSGDAARLAKASYPWIRTKQNGQSSPSLAQPPSATPMRMQRRSVSFRESPIDLVAESEMQETRRVQEKKGVATWSEARALVEKNSVRLPQDQAEMQENILHPAHLWMEEQEKSHHKGPPEPDRDGVCLVLPLQGSLKRLGIHEESGVGNAKVASLAATLSGTEKFGKWWGWRGGHRRTGSLPSDSAIQSALGISEAVAASHSKQRKILVRNATDKGIPIMLHFQVSVQARIKAVVPGEGHLSMHVPGASIALNHYPVPSLPARNARLEKSVCVSFDNVQLQLVKEQVSTGPLVVASNLRANILSSFVPSPVRLPQSRRVDASNNSNDGSLKADVLNGSRRHLGLTLDMDTLEVKSVHLHQVDGSFAHKMISAWIPAANALRKSAKVAATKDNGPTRQDFTSHSVQGGATSDSTPSVVDVTLRVRHCAGDVRVMKNVGLTYDTYDNQTNQGLYATVSHYSKICHPNFGGAGRKTGQEGKLMSHSEMCFKLHRSRMRSIKDDVSGATLSQATFYFPDVQAAGTMKSRFNVPTAGAGTNPPNPSQGSNSPPPLRQKGKIIPSITDIDVIFSIKEMCNEVRQDMLNFLLEIQRTMKTEINMFLQAAEKYTVSLGKKRERRAAMGMQLRFKLNFLLMGIRLRAVAPDVALLLDTGFFTLQVVGRPTGLPSSKGASSHSEKALQWRIGLEGLSIAATSCHQRPGSQGRALARDHAVGGNGSATPKTWVLAHVRTNLEMQNRAEHLTLDPTESTPKVGAKIEPMSKEVSTFSLNLSHTEVTAHPGSIGCLQLLFNHFNHAIAQYQHQRQFIHLEELDNSIQRMVRTGRDAAEGRFIKAAPVLISKLSNFCMQVAIKDTWLSLMNSHEVPATFAFNVHADASPTAIFDVINPRDLTKHAAGNAGTARTIDDNALVAFLELIELRAQSSSQGAGGTKRVLSHLEFLRLEIGFASALKAWIADHTKSAARGDLRYNPGRIVLERASADLQVATKTAAKLVNAEEVQGSLVVTLPGFDVEVNARTFESAFIFYNTWVATAVAGGTMSGVLHSAMPSNSSPPPNATGGAAAVEHDAELLAAKKEPSTDSASNDGNQANGVADTGVQEEHESSKKGSSTDQAIDASGLQSSATLVPYEPAVSMSSPPKSSFMSGIPGLQRTSRTLSRAATSWWQSPAPAASSATLDDASPQAESAATAVGSGMQAYRAKLRVMSLDVTIFASAGHLTVFEKDARSHQYGSNAFSKSDGARVEGTSQSRFGDAGVARGELLRVPLPEFDVAGNATLVLALGGLQEHNVKWLSQSQACINGVPLFLPDSIVVCVFRMPRDEAGLTESLLFSPSILSFVNDIQSLHRKHLHPLQRMKRSGKLLEEEHDKAAAGAAALATSTTLVKTLSAPLPGPSHKSTSADVALPKLRRDGAEHARSLVPSSAREEDVLGEGETGEDLQVASQDALSAPSTGLAPLSGIFFMSDIVYSMRFAELELKLSGGDTSEGGGGDGGGLAQGYEHSDSSKDVLALLSAQVLDVTAIVSHKLQPQATQWFSSVAMNLERLSLSLAQSHAPLTGGGGGERQKEDGGFVELRDVSGAVCSKSGTETGVLVLVRTIDVYLNLRSVGKGLALLRAWVPTKEAAGKQARGRGNASTSAYRHVASPPATEKAEVWGAGTTGTSPQKAQKKRHLRVSVVLGRVEVQLEHPLGATRCRILNIHDRGPEQSMAARGGGGKGRRGGVDSSNKLRRNAQSGIGAARERMMIGLWCGFEVGAYSRPRMVWLRGWDRDLSPLGSKISEFHGQPTLNAEPIYSLRVGKISVYSPKDSIQDLGLEVKMESHRLLLHSHSLTSDMNRYDSVPGVAQDMITAGSRANGWHGEVSNLRAFLSFDSVVFFQLLAEELQACTHVTRAIASSSSPAVTPNSRLRTTHTFKVGDETSADADPWAGGPVPDGAAGVEDVRPAHVWVRYKTLVVRASAETVPTCRRVLKRFAALFHDDDFDLKLGSTEYRGGAGGQVQPPIRKTSFKAFGSSEYDDEVLGVVGSKPSAPAMAAGNASAHKNPAPSLVIGSVDISGFELHVALYGGEMRDSSECAMLALNQLILIVSIDLQQELDGVDGGKRDVIRHMDLELGSCILLKVKKGPLPAFQEYLKNAVTAESIKQGRVGLRGAEIIMHMPHSRLKLSSIQTGSDIGALSQLIHCEFDSDFKHPIQVTVDAYLYQFLTTLARLFAEASSAVSIEDEEFELFSPTARGMSHPASPSTSFMNKTRKNSSMINGVGGGQSSREVARRKLAYRCIWFKLEPQIAVAHDAYTMTDIVEILGQLGFTKKEDIVASMHEVFINNVEGILLMVVKRRVSDVGSNARKKW